MAQQTPNAQATARANELVGWAGQLKQLLNQGRILSTAVTEGNLQALWNNFATYTPAADGSQPATNDAGPNVAHPIAGINVSANELEGFSYMVNDFITFMTSTSASPPQQNREATIVDALM